MLRQSAITSPHYGSEISSYSLEMPPGSRADGLLGLSFLRRFETIINFEKGFVRVNNP